MPTDLADTHFPLKRRRYAAGDADTTSQGISPAAIGKACVSKPRFDDETDDLATHGETRCYR